MIDNYKAEIKDGFFLCFACRKSWEYKTQCSLDFKGIAGRPRFLICNDDFKTSTFDNFNNQGWLGKEEND